MAQSHKISGSAVRALLVAAVLVVAAVLIHQTPPDSATQPPVPIQVGAAPVKAPPPQPAAQAPKPLAPAIEPPSTSRPAGAAAFPQTRYVSADRVRLRSGPSSKAVILVVLPKDQAVSAGASQDGWTKVQLQSGVSGWIGAGYLRDASTAPASTPPPKAAKPAPKIGVTAPRPAAGGPSCSPRRSCTQIGSCAEARAYLANCGWGGRLDRDGDGVPCESLCR